MVSGVEHRGFGTWDSLHESLCEVNPQCELGTSLLGQDPAKRLAALITPPLSLSLSLSPRHSVLITLNPKTGVGLWRLSGFRVYVVCPKVVAVRVCEFAILSASGFLGLGLGTLLNLNCAGNCTRTRSQTNPPEGLHKSQSQDAGFVVLCTPPVFWLLPPSTPTPKSLPVSWPKSGSS